MHPIYIDTHPPSAPRFSRECDKVYFLGGKLCDKSRRARREPGVMRVCDLRPFLSCVCGVGAWRVAGPGGDAASTSSRAERQSGWQITPHKGPNLTSYVIRSLIPCATIGSSSRGGRRQAVAR